MGPRVLINNMSSRDETRNSISLNRLLYPLGTIVPAQTLQFQNIILPFERNEQIVPEQLFQEQVSKQSNATEKANNEEEFKDTIAKKNKTQEKAHEIKRNCNS